jgi:hypothetical protein
LTARVEVSQDGLELEHFLRAVAGCKSLQLTFDIDDEDGPDISCLADVQGSLERLTVFGGDNSLPGYTALTSLSRLRELELDHARLETESPWAPLASLVSLQELRLWHVYAHGDPSPLLALTGLTSLLVIEDHDDEHYGGNDDPLGFTFSTLQPLSTLQQLQRLDFDGGCFTASSLEGLSGLNRLASLRMSYNSELCSLAGASTSLTSLSLCGMKGLSSMVGLADLVQLEHLEIRCRCGIKSLLCLTALTNLHSLEVIEEHDIVNLRGIEGVKGSLTSLELEACFRLENLSGLEQQVQLQNLRTCACGVTSLQPVAELRAGGLTQLCIDLLPLQPGARTVLELPHLPPTLQYQVTNSHVHHVVLAGEVQGLTSAEVLYGGRGVTGQFEQCPYETFQVKQPSRLLWQTLVLLLKAGGHMVSLVLALYVWSTLHSWLVRIFGSL